MGDPAMGHPKRCGLLVDKLDGITSSQHPLAVAIAFEHGAKI